MIVKKSYKDNNLRDDVPYCVACGMMFSDVPVAKYVPKGRQSVTPWQ